MYASTLLPVTAITPSALRNNSKTSNDLVNINVYNKCFNNNVVFMVYGIASRNEEMPIGMYVGKI